MSHIILICSYKEFNVSKLNFDNFNIEICDYSLYCEFENIIKNMFMKFILIIIKIHFMNLKNLFPKIYIKMNK